MSRTTDDRNDGAADSHRLSSRRATSHREGTRRDWFGRIGSALCSAALAELLIEARRASGFDSDSLGGSESTRPPQARSVIHLFMNGGPSQMDLFDPKPELDRRHGEEWFDAIAGEVEFPDAAGAMLRSPFRFDRHGESGMWVSEVMPHLAGQVDRLTMIRSMFTTNLTHEPALYKIQSGSEFLGRPSLGAWISYGLGNENRNLPSYVVLDDPRGLPVNGIDNWTSGFLPPNHQGTRLRATGAPILNLLPDFEAPDGVRALERQLRERLDRRHLATRPGQPRLGARLDSFELAARMQTEAVEALDLSDETAETLALYGIDHPTTESYGRRCLIARRLIERGVRFVQLFIDGQIWDNHADIASSLRSACERTDKPVAGLLVDLDRRGLLDETLVVWGGEMGRLPIAQLPGDKDASKAGRDHNKNAICTWMAGGGVRRGLTFGATDELGFAAVEDRVSVEDWHATILHLTGLDHHRLFVERNGLEERLTGVTHPRVVREIIA